MIFPTSIAIALFLGLVLAVPVKLSIKVAEGPGTKKLVFQSIIAALFPGVLFLVLYAIHSLDSRFGFSRDSVAAVVFLYVLALLPSLVLIGLFRFKRPRPPR